MKIKVLGVALAASVGMPTWVLASSVPDPSCRIDAFPVVLVDDRIHTAAWQSEAARGYRLPNFATVGRAVAERLCGLIVLDADPYFGPGRGPEPWLLLRGRVSEVKAVDRSLADKADTAVRRYIESYIGAPEMQQAVVDMVEVAVDVVCIEHRKALRTLVGTGRRDADIVPPDNARVYAVAVEQALASLVKDAGSLATACPARNSKIGSQGVPK